MTTRSPRGHAPFDAKRAFRTVRAVQVNGVVVGPGQPFDVSSVTPRRLRQLYETRYLAMGEGAASGAVPRRRTADDLPAASLAPAPLSPTLPEPPTAKPRVERVRLAR